MSQAKKNLLSFLICISLAFSAHASVSSDDDDYISVGSSKPLIAQSSGPPLAVQAPPSIVQDTLKTSGLSSSQMADAKDLKLKDIVELREYFKKGFLEITPKTYSDLATYAASYKKAFKAYDKGLSLKGWNEQNDLEGLLKLLCYFNAVREIKCHKNIWQEKTVINTLGNAIQYYETLEALDLKDINLNDKAVLKLLKALPNPAHLKLLNIKATTLSIDAQSETKKKYPNIAEFVVGTETPPHVPKVEPKTVKETPIAKAEITIEKVGEPKAPSLKPLYSPSSTKAQTPVVTSGTPKAIETKEEDKRALEMKFTIPIVAKGYEEIYQRFLKGALIYRPDEGSDKGMITLPIAQLANPLEGTFDLSRCGDAGKYLSIATGYRKGKIAENKDKVEIWLAPRFLIEKELETTASHFKDIMSGWSEKAPVAIFYTWGNWGNLSWYDYLTTQNMDELSNNNLYEKWRARVHSPRWPIPCALFAKNFMFILN